MPKQGYKIHFLPHTADIRVQLDASSQETLFQAGLAAMNRLLKKNGCGKPGVLDINLEVDVRSTDATALLVDFLSEILTATCTEKTLFCRVRFDELTLHHLRASVSGRAVEDFDEDIKAVTYHEAEVVHDKKTGRWRTSIIFDI